MDTNPYNPLKPVLDPTMFYGQDDALRFLTLNLSGRRTPRALVVLGTRGIGKSSLLSQVPLVVDERYPSVKIDAATIERDNPVAFVATIVDQTRAMMSVIEASTYRLPPFPDVSDPKMDLLGWLADEYLEVVFSAIRRTRHLILMVDNVHLLLDAMDEGYFPANFMSYWQDMLDRYEQLDLLFSLDIAYEARALQTPPLDDPNLHYRLAPLDEASARNLLLEPMQTSYGIEDEVLRRIMLWTGGHPYHVQAFGRLLYRRWADDRGRVNLMTMNDLAAVYPAALEMARDTINPTYKALRPNERLVLTALLDINAAATIDEIATWLQSADHQLEGVQIAAALRGLEYVNVLTVDNDERYDFVSQLEADWLRRQKVGVPTTADKMPTVPAWRGYVLIAALAIGLTGAVLLLTSGDSDSPSEDVAVTTTLEPDAPTPLPRPIFEFGG